ncbi:MAG: DivIVA domain-containing protein [Clostridia bacterium]|nr:DivIVA domain-containing protein [Clostridia bacterium]
MLSANDVREVKFAKAMGGYKQEEVDAFLDSVEEDYRNYEAFSKNTQAKIDELTAEIAQLKDSQGSLQNVLISAQQVADKIVNDARIQADAILAEAKVNAEKATEEAKNMLYDFDAKFNEKKLLAEQKLAKETEDAIKKKEAIEAATADAVRRQQALFNRIKIDVAAFKNDLMEMYKKHIELIAKLPDNIAMDAESAAEAVALVIDETPDMKQFVPVAEAAAIVEALAAEELAVEEPVVETEEAVVEPVSEGFVVNVEQAEPIDIFSVSDNDENDGDDFGFSNSFFNRNK